MFLRVKYRMFWVKNPFILSATARSAIRSERTENLFSYPNQH